MMREHSSRLKRQRKRIGFVPTMGYLHDGHLSLVKRSIKETDKTIVSIFVNPTQFGPREDLAKYPRDIKRDEGLLNSMGVDALFYPTVNQMYPRPYSTYVNVEDISYGLCGKFRPGHFRGVSTIVAKLFNIVKPDVAYFGQKDAQQAAVIKKMVQDLNMDLQIKALPTIRERDGLVQSSRNTYLGPQEREDALVLHDSLLLAKRMIKKGEKSSKKIVNAMRNRIKTKRSTRIEYIEIVDSKTLKPIKGIKGELLIALAVYVGRTRLIDNISLKAR